MAEEPPLNYFPDPPPFYKHFTAENLERLAVIKREEPVKKLDLDVHLRYLTPPPPPGDHESFHVFGEAAKSSGTNNFTQTMEFVSKTLGEQFVLSDWTYTQLYPPTDSTSTEANIDRQQYLNRFNRSILIEYVSLLGAVALNPTSEHKDRKLKHILTLVCNMHALINEYRPHQARETLIRIMEEQVRRKKAEVQGVRDMRGRVESVLGGLKAGEVEEAASAERVDRRAQRVWDAMDVL
ncbi:Mediator of RNA polymerase II transcription subunit 7 [Ascochyta lentis]